MDSRKEKTGKDLNRVIHERTRFLILAALAGSGDQTRSFNDLKKELELTSGNLSVHLKCLEDAGYVRIKKKFVERKPLTLVILNQEGLRSLDDYLRNMENIISKLKEKRQ